MNKKKIAVVGSGISGISSAYYLQKYYDITLFEKRARLGGHTHTVTAKLKSGEEVRVDTGFIVLNDKTYPNLHKFFKDINIPVRFSDMSFSYHAANNNFAYAGNGLSGLFAKKSNIFSSRFIKFLIEIKRFSNIALNDLGNNILKEKDLKSYLFQHNFSSDLIDFFILPMGAAIWSTPAAEMLKFPAETFIYFFKNHGLLSLKDRPKWQTVIGGSSSYLEAFKENFSGVIKTNSGVQSIKRKDSKVIVAINNEEFEFDKIIIATHANQVLNLLKDASDEEHTAYKSWYYNKNKTVLHSDVSILPKNKKLWTSWNYYEDQEGRLSVSYHMNRLQGIKTNTELIVSLNCKNINPDKIYFETIYEHPLYTKESLASQAKIQEINGNNNTYFAGAYLGYGFHEDGIKSALKVVDKIKDLK